MDAWEDITGGPHFTGVEYHAAWQKFYNRFVFSPSIYAFPGFADPTPSTTYFIGHVYGQTAYYPPLVNDLNARMLEAFRRCVPADGWLYALEWRKPGYRFRPHVPFNDKDERSWPVPVLPDGDYYIFLAEDLRFGVVGHPWEQTMCIYGAELLEAVGMDSPLLFDTMIRENGRQLRPLVHGLFSINETHGYSRNAVGPVGMPLADFLQELETVGYLFPEGLGILTYAITTEEIFPV